MFVASTAHLLMLVPLALAAAVVLARQQQRIAVLERETRGMRRGLLDLESLFEQAPLGMAVFDAEGRFVRINRLLAEINGVPADDHIGRPLRELVPGVADVSEAAFRQAMETRKPVVGLVIDGVTAAQPERRRTWRLDVHPVFGRGRDVLGVSVAVEDITEQQRLAAALRDSERRERRRVAELEGVMEATPVAVFLAHDRQCHQVTVNAAGRRLLRLGPGESPSVTGPGIRAFDVYADGNPVAPDRLPLQRAAATGVETRGAELAIRFADGHVMQVVMHAVPLRDEGGRVRGAAAAFVVAGDGGDGGRMGGA
ncbi:PAS domain-containing protein [uncultured Massilia sp.]|uniref:PAS domain-containing protein n=1 Tax=uncultured Massilia sp. TaxID=169973 RepID=UPI0025F5736F|nr:PAS domain-containing protein [uncultured Massilia sp.]